MDVEEFVNAALGQMFLQAQVLFGVDVESYWFYDSDTCPGCGRKIDVIKIDGQDALSLNVFVYRERRVLIGYFLCRECTEKIFEAAERNPGKQTPLHTTIEMNLIKAYLKHGRPPGA